jgi:hypothetical protein
MKEENSIRIIFKARFFNEEVKFELLSNLNISKPLL